MSKNRKSQSDDSENQNKQSEESLDTDTNREAEGAAPSGGESSNDLDSIADNLIRSMPDVQEHAIEQEEIETREKAAGLTDVDGNAFDPSYHKTDKHGNPSLSTKGKLIKRPGRKPGQKTAQKSSIGGIKNEIDIGEEKRRQNARMCGVALANSIMQVGINLGGDEWRPVKNDEIGIDEKRNLEDAFANYAESRGWNDFPPGIALTIAVVSYAAPRFTMPKTQERVKRTGNWFKKWLADRKLKKHGLRAVNASAEDNQKTAPNQHGKMEA